MSSDSEPNDAGEEGEEGKERRVEWRKSVGEWNSSDGTSTVDMRVAARGG